MHCFPFQDFLFYLSHIIERSHLLATSYSLSCKQIETIRSNFFAPGSPLFPSIQLAGSVLVYDPPRLASAKQTTVTRLALSLCFVYILSLPLMFRDSSQVSLYGRSKFPSRLHFSFGIVDPSQTLHSLFSHPS